MQKKSTRGENSHIERMDSEIQRFLFEFLPELFSDIDDHMDAGFTNAQVHDISKYFNQVINLSAIAYPHRFFLIFGTVTYLRIRKLHRLFQRWCRLCETKASLKHKERCLLRMQDAVAKLSRNYQVVSQVSLTKEQQKILKDITSTTSDVIKGMSKIGLKAVGRFAEKSSFSGFPL